MRVVEVPLDPVRRDGRRREHRRRDDHPRRGTGPAASRMTTRNRRDEPAPLHRSRGVPVVVGRREGSVTQHDRGLPARHHLLGAVGTGAPSRPARHPSRGPRALSRRAPQRGPGPRLDGPFDHRAPRALPVPGGGGGHRHRPHRRPAFAPPRTAVAEGARRGSGGDAARFGRRCRSHRPPGPSSSRAALRLGGADLRGGGTVAVRPSERRGAPSRVRKGFQGADRPGRWAGQGGARRMALVEGTRPPRPDPVAPPLATRRRCSSTPGADG